MKKLALILTALFTLALPAQAGTFTDTAGDYYEDGIEFLADRGIVNGYSDQTFRPGQTLNRAELLKILIEAEIIISDTNDSFLAEFENQTCFNDVPPGLWYTKYVCAAKDRGIVVGYSDGGFHPAQEVNFVEAVKMALETLYVPYLVTDNPWYKGPVEAASFGNYIPPTINAFDKLLSRGEISDLIARIIAKREGTLDSFLNERKNIIVTYDSIQAAQDLSNTNIAPLPPEPDPINTSNLAQYVEYSPAAFAALESGQLAILNFHASWCVTCLMLEMEILDPAKLSTLPSNLVIFKIEYDDNPDLRQQYNVVVQHTLVQVDLNGNEITTWIGGGVDTIASELQL